MHLDSASVQFVLFGLAAALISNLRKSPMWRSVVLLLASLVFIGLIERSTLALLPLAGFLALGYLCLLFLRRGWIGALPAMLVAVIFVYIWLKKYTFLPEAILLRSPYFTLGLSYIFFRVLHILIEASDNCEQRRIGLGQYLLYTLNFTTFVSGPIQRYDEFAQDQFASKPPALGAGVVGSQLERILRGFFKVNVLATLLSAFQQDALAQMNPLFPLSIRLYAAIRVAVIYPLFLYANFSGYMDLVIAIARLMRVRLPENFDRAFSAGSVVEFWNQWHITLSKWLKSYVYNPLMVALMRRFTSPSMAPMLGVFAFFVTFFLIGVWHGRTSEFLMFGLLTGGGISLNKLWQLWLTSRLGRKRYRVLAEHPAYKLFARGLNFVWFSFTLFWFWTDWKTIDSIFRALTRMQWAAVWLVAWIAASFTLGLWEWLRSLLLSVKTAEGTVLTNRYVRAAWASALGLATILLIALLNQPAPGIVYKAF